MWRKIIFLVVGALILQANMVYGVYSPGNDPSLVAWWKLDEMAGNTAFDSSANGNDGTINGNPQWVEGMLNGALDFDGNGDYVDCGNDASLNLEGEITVSAWVSIRSVASAWMCAVAKGENAWRISVNNTALSFHFGMTLWSNAGYGVNGATAVGYNEWHHVTGVFDGSNVLLYLDGMLDASGTTTFPLGTTNVNVLIGENPEATGRYWDGLIDEVGIFNRALTEEEIQVVMQGLSDPGLPTQPYPPDATDDVTRDVVLSWKPGAFADKHNVYIGTSFDDVNDASTPNASVDANSYNPPGLLDFDQTYYWRIDEVNAPPDSTIFKGDVWSFTVELYSYPLPGTNMTATTSGNSANTSGTNTVNRSGLNEDDTHSVALRDMWLSDTNQPAWIEYAFDRVYRLDKMKVWNSNSELESLLGYGFKDVSIQYSEDGETWNLFAETQFEQAPGTDDYTGNDPLDLGYIAAKSVRLTAQSNWGGVPFSSLSEVRFYYVPTYAWTHDPDGAYLPTDAWASIPVDGANDVDPDVVLTWRAGREAQTHELYVGTDANDLPQVDTVTGSPYGTYDTSALDLQLSQTYYWRINEVNEAQVPSIWEGDDVQSFTVADFVVVDDFESYTNDADSYSRVFQTWIDGAGYTYPVDVPGNGTGSYIGYDPLAGDIMETSIFHDGGSQSAPFSYGNDGKSTSEVVRTFAEAQDWTGHGITTLVLYFYGSTENVPGQLYVKINGTRVDYSGPTDALLRGRWTQWNIDLADVSAAGNVTSLTLGIEGAGSQGLLLVDDILLYKIVPEITVAEPVDPGTADLALYYNMDNNVTDQSGHGLHATIQGAGVYQDSLPGLNQALSFDGIADYVEMPIGDLIAGLGESTFAIWVNIDSDATGSWMRAFDVGTSPASGNPNNYLFLCPRTATNGAPRAAIISPATGAEDGVTAASVLSDGWHHLAVVFEAGSLTLYVDALSAGTDTTSIYPQDLGVTTNNWLGESQWDGDDLFDGMLDEFRIYSRALSAGEIEFLSDPTP